MGVKVKYKNIFHITGIYIYFGWPVTWRSGQVYVIAGTSQWKGGLNSLSNSTASWMIGNCSRLVGNGLCWVSNNSWLVRNSSRLVDNRCWLVWSRLNIRCRGLKNTDRCVLCNPIVFRKEYVILSNVCTCMILMSV